MIRLFLFIALLSNYLNQFVGQLEKTNWKMFIMNEKIIKCESKSTKGVIQDESSFSHSLMFIIIKILSFFASIKSSLNDSTILKS